MAAHTRAPAARRAGKRRRLPVLPMCAAGITVFGALSFPAASADGGCIPNNQTGMVPRNARAGDNVCVPKNIAQTVQDENNAAAKNYVPGGGAYGPKTCTSGLVWREAFDGDAVCVSPARRTETWQENANAGVGNTGGLKPQAGFTPGGAPAAAGSGGADGALLAAVNDARVNPGKYPPHPKDPNTGQSWDTSGASTKACPSGFADSGALDNTASTHNGFIATMDKTTVNKYPNMHKTASGGLATDQGGPITQAGYRTTGEIVADGFTSEAAAVQFWMQDDGGANNWGHRALILNCGLTDAGAAHFAGGPWGHYWTVDMGAH